MIKAPILGLKLKEVESAIDTLNPEPELGASTIISLLPVSNLFTSRNLSEAQTLNEPIAAYNIDRNPLPKGREMLRGSLHAGG